MTGGKDHRGVTQRLARVAANLIYRGIDIGAWDPALATGPVLAVSNHFGGLSDGVLLIDCSARMPRIVARDVIWKTPVLGRIAPAIGMIPVHRRADGAVTTNDQMFAAAYEALGAAEMVLIFPEGVTMDVPHMAPVRTGAARMALGARASGVSGIRILPLGLHYEDKAGFRTRVLVNPGAAIDLDEWAGARPGGVADGAQDREAVSALTEDIDHALRLVAPNFQDWATVGALRQAARVLLSDVDPTPNEYLRYGDEELLASRLNRAPEPRRSQLVDVSGTYSQVLKNARTSDGAVVTARRAGGSSWRWLRDLILTLLLLPYAFVGLLVAVVPLLLVVIASRLPISPAVRATAVPGIALLSFVAHWFLTGVAIGISGGWAWGIAALMLYPFFLGALFLVAEQIVGLRRHWQVRRRPHPSQLPALDQLRADVSAQAWGAL